jgi:hypothetical protein
MGLSQVIRWIWWWAVVWLLATLALLYLFIYGDGWVVPLLSACVIAVLLYVLRRKERLLYGVLEFVAGVCLLGSVVSSGSGRGPFSSEFSDDFARFDALIVLQSFAGIFILVRGLDNTGEGWAKWRLRRDTLHQWRRGVG